MAPNNEPKTKFYRERSVDGDDLEVEERIKKILKPSSPTKPPRIAFNDLIANDDETDNLVEEIYLSAEKTDQRIQNVDTNPMDERINEEKPVKHAEIELQKEIEIKVCDEEITEKPMTPPSPIHPSPTKCSPTPSTDSSTISTSSNFSSSSPFKVVVAIDFGTTYSGYAYSNKQTPTQINLMRMKTTCQSEFDQHNHKIPTILLLKPDETFHSFGFQAREHYHSLSLQESEKWFYFEKFKLTLHTTSVITRTTQIESINGKSLSALIVFTESLRFFRDQALADLNSSSQQPVKIDDICWVVTVPTIWRHSAKQFMRHAAYQAGLATVERPQQLLIALEPEAAAIYCRKLRLNQCQIDEMKNDEQILLSAKENHKPRKERINFGATRIGTICTGDRLKVLRTKTGSLNSIKDSRPTLSNVFIGENENQTKNDTNIGTENQELERSRDDMVLNRTGTRYMIIDCGGGTIDVTVHEIFDQRGFLKELYKATGDTMGSITIDSAFEQLLITIFSQKFIEQFRQQFPSAYVTLMSTFELRKRQFTGEEPPESTVNITLPFAFIDSYKKTRNTSVESAIKRLGTKCDIKYCQKMGTLKLSASLVRRLFEPTLRRIVEHINNVINRNECARISFVFLVGGFSGNGFLQRIVRDSLGPKLKLIIPQSLDLAILRGAVLFGHNPNIIQIRRSRMTYGIGIVNEFIHGEHPLAKKIIRHGQQWCTDIFDAFVRNDQSIVIGECVQRSYTPVRADQQYIELRIYCCENHQPKFITDTGVYRCGTLILDFSDNNFSRDLVDDGVGSGDDDRKSCDEKQEKMAAEMYPKREIQVKMIFGDTEIKVCAVDVSTGKSVKAEIDFLSN